MNSIEQKQNEEILLDKEKTFESFGLDDRILKILNKLKFNYPTLIQSSTIPLALNGKDIVAKARTGSGKTAAYSIPILQTIITLREKEKKDPEGTQALILLPTRELCEQVRDHFKTMATYTPYVSILSLAADVPLASQIPKLKLNPTILIATPGRLLMHLQAKNLILEKSLKILVVDEADRILSFGFDEDMQNLVPFLPKTCQCFLMSATLSTQVQKLKKLLLHSPAILKLEEKTVAPRLIEYAVRCPQEDKYLIIFTLTKLKIIPGKAIFFVNTIRDCYKLKLFFERFFIKAAVLNSELPVASRSHILQQFNLGKFEFLIATDEPLKGEEEDEEDEEVDDERERGEKGNEDEEESEGDEEEEEESSDDEEEEEESSDDEENDKEEETSDEDKEEAELKKKDSEETSEQKKKQKKAQKQKEQKEQKAKMKKKAQAEKGKDKEYGVSRGVDFKGVQTVVNFDLPTKVKSYIHRVGRTARGGARGTALSLVSSEEESIMQKIEKIRTADGRTIQPYKFNSKIVEGFRYRVEDILLGITKKQIQEARLKEIKDEILNSEKLKAHFASNTAELNLLQHDKTLLESRRQVHLKKVPSYLLPESIRKTLEQSTPKKRKKPWKGGNVLKDFKVKKGKRSNGSQTEFMNPNEEVDRSQKSEAPFKVKKRKK